VRNRAALRAVEEINRDRQSFLRQEMAQSKPGIRLWTEPAPEKADDGSEVAARPRLTRAPANADDEREASAAPTRQPVQARTEEPWSLGEDLEKYRSYAVSQGSRESGESLGKALEQAGLTLEDGVNVLLLGYASERGAPFRKNDGKGLLDDPGRAPAQAGATVVSFGDGLYSLADLITLDGLPDHEKDVYRDNHPIVRPLVFTGQTIGGAWKTTEEIGNAVTWGYFDNVTGTIGMVLVDIIELLKHTGEAVTNLVRLPVRLISGGDEGAEEAMDWVLLVPLEFVSNSVAMEGISNMQDYEMAFAHKGVIGSTLELAGSTFIVYRVVDELIDELEDDNGHGSSNGQDGQQPQQPSPEPPAPEPPVVEVSVNPDQMGPGDLDVYFPINWDLLEGSGGAGTPAP
jgi:hypothetical protein